MADWDTLMREYGQVVFNTAWRVLGHAQDAEDVAQEVFAEAHCRSNGTPVIAWAALLRRMAVCRALDALRRRRCVMSLEHVQEVAGDCDPQAIAEGRELETRFRAALAELTPREAEVFSLRYFEDYSYREIADSLGISLKAASTALYQARLRLESLLVNGE